MVKSLFSTTSQTPQKDPSWLIIFLISDSNKKIQKSISILLKLSPTPQHNGSLPPFLLLIFHLSPASPPEHLTNINIQTLTPKYIEITSTLRLLLTHILPTLSIKITIYSLFPSPSNFRIGIQRDNHFTINRIQIQKRQFRRPLQTNFQRDLGGVGGESGN